MPKTDREELDGLPPPSSSLIEDDSVGRTSRILVGVAALFVTGLLILLAMTARQWGAKAEKKKGVQFTPDAATSGYLPAKPVAPVKPEFPEGVGGSMYEGEVTLGVTISPEGAVEEVVVVKGVQPILDSIAVKAAGKAVYQPGSRDGKPARSKILVKVPFEAF